MYLEPPVVMKFPSCFWTWFMENAELLINAYVINLQSTMSPNVSQKYYFSNRLETIEMIFFFKQASRSNVISELVKRYQDKNIKLNFIYDTVCVLSSHIHVLICVNHRSCRAHEGFLGLGWTMEKAWRGSAPSSEDLHESQTDDSITSTAPSDWCTIALWEEEFIGSRSTYFCISI